MNKSPHCCLYRPHFSIIKENVPKYSFKDFRNNNKNQTRSTSPSPIINHIHPKLNQKQSFIMQTQSRNANIDFRLTLSREYLEKLNINNKEIFLNSFNFSPQIPEISSKYKQINSIFFAKLLGRKELHNNSYRILQEYEPNYSKIFENQSGLIIDYKKM